MATEDVIEMTWNLVHIMFSPMGNFSQIGKLHFRKKVFFTPKTIHPTVQCAG